MTIKVKAKDLRLGDIIAPRCSVLSMRIIEQGVRGDGNSGYWKYPRVAIKTSQFTDEFIFHQNDTLKIFRQSKRSLND